MILVLIDWSFLYNAVICFWADSLYSSQFFYQCKVSFACNTVNYMHAFHFCQASSREWHMCKFPSMRQTCILSLTEHLCAMCVRATIEMWHLRVMCVRAATEVEHMNHVCKSCHKYVALMCHLCKSCHRSVVHMNHVCKNCHKYVALMCHVCKSCHKNVALMCRVCKSYHRNGALTCHVCKSCHWNGVLMCRVCKSCHRNVVLMCHVCKSCHRNGALMCIQDLPLNCTTHGLLYKALHSNVAMCKTYHKKYTCAMCAWQAMCM